MALVKSLSSTYKLFVPAGEVRSVHDIELTSCMVLRGAGAWVSCSSIDMEGRPRGGGGWSRPPAPPAAEATRAAAGQQKVKVKHIVTREVSTDQANFKDVVQRLTGKDSDAARAAVVAGGAGWSGGGSSSGVTSGGATGMVLAPEEDTKRWWCGP